jgi:histidinol-phosphatase (PHP family)
MPDALTFSYHTHNQYCDGEGRIEDVVEAAIAANLTEIGISSHAPVPFETGWTMPPARLADYVREVHRVQVHFRDRITVLFGSEIDFIPDPRVVEFQQREVLPLEVDYFIGSVHFLGSRYPPRSIDGTEQEFQALLHEEYADDIEAMVVDYYGRVRGMLSLPKVKIVGHIDRIKRWNADGRYFADDEPWYRKAVDETLRAVAATDKFVELNTSAWRNGLSEPYPALWILRQCREYGIPVPVSSDAHKPADVTNGFERAQACLMELGILAGRLEPK